VTAIYESDSDDSVILDFSIDDDYDISAVYNSHTIQPYMFEPYLSDYEESDSDAEAEPEQEPDAGDGEFLPGAIGRLQNVAW